MSGGLRGSPGAGDGESGARVFAARVVGESGVGWGGVGEVGGGRTARVSQTTVALIVREKEKEFALWGWGWRRFVCWSIALWLWAAIGVSEVVADRLMPSVGCAFVCRIP